MIRGADVSAWQGAPDLSSLKSRFGWSFVFIKAGEGASITDSRFAANWAHALSAGLLRGAYYFARPEESSPEHQADRLIDAARARPGKDLLCLDLEASKLSQSATNAWAKRFGDRLRSRAPGVRTVLYMGSGYASNGTGRGLSAHYDWWWYPQYPSSKSTTTWPASFSPWLPTGLTCGWSRPHIWQWSSTFAGQFDANVSPLTIDQLADGGQPTPPPQEDNMLSGSISAGKGPKPLIKLKGGAFTTVELAIDNTRENPDLGVTRQPPASIRLAMHQPGRKGTAKDVTVGAALNDTKGWADSVPVKLPSGCDYVSVERTDDGSAPVGFVVY